MGESAPRALPRACCRAAVFETVTLRLVLWPAAERPPAVSAAITITAAILVSGLVSISFTPMLCSRFLKVKKHDEEGWFAP